MVKRPFLGLHDAGRPALIVLLTTILLDFIGFSVLIPVLPFHFKAIGADAVDIGLVLAIYVIAQVIFLPFWGWISDRVGRRPVLLVCLLGTAASFAIMAVAPTLAVFYIARAFGGFFGASVGTAQAYVTDITADEDRAHGLGIVSAAGSVGIVIGPGLGGLLYQMDPLAPFYAPAALAFVAFVGAALFLPESKRPESSTLDWRSFLKTLIPTPVLLFSSMHDSRTRAYLYLFFHVFASFAALEAMFTLYAEERFGWNAMDTGLSLSYLAVVMAIAQGALVGRLTRYVSESTVVIGGLALAGPCMMALSQVSSVPALAAVGSGIAIGIGVAFPAFTSLFSKNCGSPEESGEYLAHSQAMIHTGRGLGVIWGGLAFKYLGPGSPFFLGGIGLLAALGLILIGLPLFLTRRS